MEVEPFHGSNGNVSADPVVTDSEYGTGPNHIGFENRVFGGTSKARPARPPM